MELPEAVNEAKKFTRFVKAFEKLQETAETLLGADQGWRAAKNLGGRAAMDVLLLEEGVHQGALAAEVGQHAELDLRVVRREEDEAVLRHKTGPDPAALFSADGDVLEVGLVAAQPPGGRDRLVEARVDAPLRVDAVLQRVDVGALELGQLAVL